MSRRTVGQQMSMPCDGMAPLHGPVAECDMSGVFDLWADRLAECAEAIAVLESAGVPMFSTTTNTETSTL